MVQNNYYIIIIEGSKNTANMTESFPYAGPCGFCINPRNWRGFALESINGAVS